MKSYKYPIILTFFASLIPFLGHLLSLDFKAITYSPILIAGLLIFLRRSIYKISSNEFVLLFSSLFYVFIVVVVGIGIGSGGPIYIIVLSLIFSRFFTLRSSSIKTDFNNIIYLILFFYKFNVIIIYLELLIVLAGFQDVLIKIFTKSYGLPGYKNYNHAHFLNWIGFTDVSGLVGLFMGSQAAGMLAVISTIVFFQLKEFERNWRLWISFSFGSIIFCSNMTSLVMFVVGLFFLIFIFKSHLNLPKHKLLFLALLPVSIPFIFFKIDNVLEYEVYLLAIFPAVDIFFNNLLEFKWFDLMFGYGSVGHYAFESMGIGIGTDFGLLALINQAGIILFVISATAIIYINWKSLYLKKRINRISLMQESIFEENYFQFHILNVVIIDMLFISLIHYTSAIEVGLRELFALHVALAIFYVRHLYDQYNTIYKTNLKNGW